MQFRDDNDAIFIDRHSQRVERLSLSGLRRRRWWKLLKIGSLALASCAVLAPVTYAQQSRWGDDQQSRARIGQSFAPPELPSQEALDGSERRARMKEERRMRWLKQSNGAISEGTNSSEMSPRNAMTGDTPECKPPARMNGLSQEERYRLRSDIREAGFSAYAPEGRRRGGP